MKKMQRERGPRLLLIGKVIIKTCIIGCCFKNRGGGASKLETA